MAVLSIVMLVFSSVSFGKKPIRSYEPLANLLGSFILGSDAVGGRNPAPFDR